MGGLKIPGVRSVDISGVSVAGGCQVSFQTDGKLFELEKTELPPDAPLICGPTASIHLRRLTDGKPNDEIGTVSLTYRTARLHTELDSDDLTFLDRLREIDLPKPYDDEIKEALDFEIVRDARLHLALVEMEWNLGHELYSSSAVTVLDPHFAIGGGAAVVTFPDRDTAVLPTGTGKIGTDVVHYRRGHFQTRLSVDYRGLAGWKIFGQGFEAFLRAGYNF